MKAILKRTVLSVIFFISAFCALFAQEGKEIRGIVTDNEGPLVGVAVYEKDEPSNGTITDLAGNYSITLQRQESTLVFSYVGYKKQEIRVNNRNKIDVFLKQDSELLDEVVVVGYGVQKKGMLTGAISNVKSDKITVAPIGNVTNMMAGQLPGVISKQESGIPGDDGASINIRGFGTPLIIVDGVESSMSNIDPWQIESISVLKDGAASIYGARAGNGVVVITTKKGMNGRTVIDVNSSFTLQGSTKIHRPQSSGQRAQLLRESHINQGLPMEQVPYTEEQIEKYFRGDDPHYLNSDWFKATIREYAPQQNHNIVIRGGTERLQFYNFFSYNKQETILKHDGGFYERFNFQSNINAEIINNLHLSVNVNSIWENRNFSYLGLFGGSNFWDGLYDSDPKLTISLPDDTKLAYGGIAYGNIIDACSTKINGYTKTLDRENRINATLKYDVERIPGLTLKAFIDMTENTTRQKEFRKQHKFYRYNIDTGEYTFEKSGQDPTGLTESYRGNKVFTQQYSVSYENLLKEKHRISVLGLFESIAYRGNDLLGKRGDFISDAIEQINAGGIGSSYASGSASEMGRASWVGRFNYAYQDKYLIETIIRADASAKFPPKKRWGYFPSISIGWVVSEEDFMKNYDKIDHLKLRASYGASGNDAVGNFQYLSGYAFDGQYILGDKTYPGLYMTGLANPLLTWEKMNIYNVGVDFSYNNRTLYGSFDGFYRLRSGIPGHRSVSLPSSFGAELPIENLNSINTRGFEFVLGVSKKMHDFQFDVSANITWARSKWDYFDEPEYLDPDQKRLNKNTGQWVDRQIGYVSDGLFTSMEQINSLPYIYSELGGNSSLRPGDIIYKDLNEDGVLDWRDQKEIGNGNIPKWIYGINGNIQYKNIDMSLLFQGAFGYSTNVDMQSVPTDLSYQKRWTEDNNDPNALVPRIGGSSTNSYFSDYRLHNTSYIRLKNASIGYNLPSKLLSKYNIQKVRIYLAGTNLLTFSSLSKYGVDPEVPDGTGPTGMPVSTVYYYPQQRTFSIGLNLTF